jgi:mannosyltransferase OCH1-like enzyme
MVIPRRLIRTIPAEPSDEVEDLWRVAVDIHAGWDLATFRDPIDPSGFPLTSTLWDRCTSGAQLAGLIRLEALLAYGGIYIDSDVEVFRSFEPLLGCQAFAAYEDAEVVPDAVLGAEPGHPAIRACLELALRRLMGGGDDWRSGSGAWATGPGVTTALLPGRDDVLTLPPGAFYPYHYTERRRRYENHRDANPWAFCAHHWHGSWTKEAHL